MVKKGKVLAIGWQCDLLSVSRGSYYYRPSGITEMDLKRMEKLDELYTENPTRGTRRLSKALKKRFGLESGRDKVRRLMRIMRIAAIYPKKHLSIANKAHLKYPYLLRGLRITHPNQVWSTDITFIRLEKGFVYLTAVMDGYSRYVLSWRISTMLDRGFCIEALNEALEKHGRPEIFNTDQGSQYTSDEFTGILKSNQIKISMDGLGRALDNVFVERLWRTVKQEEVYLKGYRNVSECREGLSTYFDRYNNNI
ncbi:IS3 family transposase [Nitrospira defluvii]|nr:IS3 family transposase [Nitrospira defluvii]